MGKKKKHNAPAGMLEAFKKANRELELERNGGRWAAVDRPHKNRKKYDRNRQERLEIPDGFVFQRIGSPLIFS